MRVTTTLTAAYADAVDQLADTHQLHRGAVLRALIAWAIDHPSTDLADWITGEHLRATARASAAGREAARIRWETP